MREQHRGMSVHGVDLSHAAMMIIMMINDLPIGFPINNIISLSDFTRGSPRRDPFTPIVTVAWQAVGAKAADNRRI